MAVTLCQEILRRAGPEGALTCGCGQVHRLGLRQLLLGEGALEESAALARARHPAGGLWVLSDERTEAAAGARWKGAAGPAGLRGRVLPAHPRPVPTEALAAELLDEVRALAPGLLVAIGSGVVSDLVKRVSLQAGIANWCVATAPSVDAYTSATAAIRVGGDHQALPARPSELVACDLEVLRAAPRPLVLAGLGDLLAKFPARLDWALSHLLTGEPYCETVAGWALESARQALRAARHLDRDPAAAALALADAVLVSGLAMQALGSSRPAASAEHTLAHYWEAVHAVPDERLDLHGILVGAASRLVLGAYQAFYGGPAAAPTAAADRPLRLAALAGERPWEEALEEEMRPFGPKMAAELRGKPAGGEALARRLDAYAAQRIRVAALAGPLLDELAGAVAQLEGLGFPFSLDRLGIAPAHRALPLRHLRRLRSRYTTFDLAHELGVEPTLWAGAGG